MEVAEMLEPTQYTNAIPHAAYYSCLTLSKHKLNSVFGIDYNTMNAGHNGSHEYIIRTLEEKIKNSNNTCISAREYTNNIRTLKSIREEADYENINIDEEKYKRTILFAKELRNKIDKLK